MGTALARHVGEVVLVSTTCWRCRSEQPGEAAFCGACADQGDPAPLRLGRYEVTNYLGRGSFGAVYLCSDPVLQRQVAIKRLVNVESHAVRALNEMRSNARIEHRAIVQLYDADSERGLLIMEYVDGGNLAERMSTDPNWVKQNFTRLFTEIGEGLRAAHLQRTLHRDIKPANILLTSDGHPKLADFGVARILGDGELAHSRLGTPSYMAPEVLFGEEGYGLDSDIHSLGCVMYEAWTGRLPFAQPGHALAMALQKQQTFAPLREVDPSVDDILNELVNGMLAPAGKRISSIEIVLQQLRHRDPPASTHGPASIDEMQHTIGAIYGLRNRSRSPLLLLGHFLVSVRVAVAALGRTDDEYHRRRMEAALLRAFAWLCALASSVNVRLSQLIWLKFDGTCPYCERHECACDSLDRKHDPQRNQDLLDKLHLRRMGRASNPRTFAQYQAMFRRIYGRINDKAGHQGVGLHTFSEIAEATDALLHLTSLSDDRQLTILYLELSDLVAWFFALLNSYGNDYAFVEAFDKLFEDGCYVCEKMTCDCPSIERELRLASWREF
jgi:serine/threonine protein kinase